MAETEPHCVETKNYGTVTYLPNPQHRDNNPKKSQWTINIEWEIYVFKDMNDYNWRNAEVGWGLCIIDTENKKLSYLGKTTDQRDVFLAKFVNDTNHSIWHGYPADYQNHGHDVPDRLVLKKWMDDKFLTKAQISKITSMKLCKI